MSTIVAALLLAAATPATAPPGLYDALERLAEQGKFSGAVVVRDSSGVRFAEGFGKADPFEGRDFTPDTVVDSASLSKPVTAAAVLSLAQKSRIHLDSPVRRYLPDYPYADGTVRHLLSHSAGLPDSAIETIVGTTNADFLAEIRARSLPPKFDPGTGFAYCNLCTTTLALLLERVTGRHYLEVVREEAALPPAVGLRPARLAEWKARAIGYRTTPAGSIERADSYDDERFYGAANLSITASQLADWGSRWWTQPLSGLRPAATSPASIRGKISGLTLGNWYCAPGGRRCHYLGHHEGFHHMLYWDSDRRISIAMVTNNSLEPALQQRLQRALVAFAEARERDGAQEIDMAHATEPAAPGSYRIGRQVTTLEPPTSAVMKVTHAGVAYDAFPLSANVRYVPGLDAYLSGSNGKLRLLTLYEDSTGEPVERR
jgi:CubicO group peptidase (beta-lactamase class C family)